jgi:hypothetical protein
MRVKSEIDTEEVLRSRLLESADDLDCPTPIAIPQRLALGSQGVETRIVDEAQMYAAARASVAQVTVTREVSEPALRRAARESMVRAAVEIPRDVFDVEAPTNIDARDPFEHVSTIEKNTAAVERVTNVEARSYDWLRARMSRGKAAESVADIEHASSTGSVARTSPVERDEHTPEPVLLVARKPRGSMAPRAMPIVEAPGAHVDVVAPRAHVDVIAPRAHVDVVAPLPRIDPAFVRPRIAPRDVAAPMRVEVAPIPSLVVPRSPDAPTLRRRVTRWLAGCALIAMVGAVATGATYLVARDMQREATASAPAAVALPVVSETRTLPVIAAPTTGTLRFSVEPVDAKISVDKIAYASSSIELPLGTHDVRVSRRGYATWRRTIEVTASTTDVFVVLAHTPKRRAARPTPRVEPIAEPTVTPIVEPTVTPIVEAQASDDEDPLEYMMSASTHRENDR